MRMGNKFIGGVQGLKLGYLYTYSKLCYLELSMTFYYVLHKWLGHECQTSLMPHELGMLWVAIYIHVRVLQ